MHTLPKLSKIYSELRNAKTSSDNFKGLNKTCILIFILPYLTFGTHQHNAWEQAQNNIYEQEKKNLVAHEGIATSS